VRTEVDGQRPGLQKSQPEIGDEDEAEAKRHAASSPRKTVTVKGGKLPSWW